MDAWASSLRPSKVIKTPQKVSFMPSPSYKRSLSKTSLCGSPPGTPKKTCLEHASPLSSRTDELNRTFVASRFDSMNKTFIANRIDSINKSFITSRRETADLGSALRKRLSTSRIPTAPSSSASNRIPTSPTVRATNEKFSTAAKASLGLRSSLSSRLATPPVIAPEKGLSDRLALLENKLESHIQMSRAMVEDFERKHEVTTKETALIKQRLDRLEKVHRPDSTDEAPEDIRTRAQLDKLKNVLKTKILEFETLRKNYERLNEDHLALRRLMDVKEAENRMLEDLLEIEREKSKKHDDELDFALQENETIRSKLVEYESRVVALHNEVLELKGNIRVFVRVRPLPPDEMKSCLSVNSPTSLTVAKLSSRDGSRVTTPYRFDRVLDTSASQREVFDEVQQLIVSALDGFNVCVIAYGQTGSGKTFTMEGPSGSNPNDLDDDRIGVIPRAFSEVFKLIDDRRDQDWEYSVHVSMLEIYNETILDLLNKHTECCIRISASDSNRTEVLHLENVSSVQVTDARQATKLFEKARSERKVGTTKCNGRSSRSHCVLRVHVKATNASTGAERESVLNLVDLAGSERVKQSEVEGIRLTETRKINSSLTQLLTVIMSLGNKAAHIPYRNSKLTHLLSTSLGNNSKALMIVHVSPAQIDVNETLNSLRFAQKVNDVQIGPRHDHAREKSHGFSSPQV